MRWAASAAAALWLWAGAAAAAVSPAPGLLDPRIRSVAYDPGQVVEVTGHTGYQMMIEFAPGERIENVSIGDSQDWQVTPNRRADLLFLKPLEVGAATNMTVVTNRRRYSFLLRAREASGPKDPRLMFGLRFDYPPEPEPTPPPPEPEPPLERNAAYTYTGSPGLAPARVFDDGRSTWFAFAEGPETPAIFAMDASGAESVVNSSVRGDYVIVDQVAPAFMLRRGKEVLTLHNDAWRAPAPGPDSPLPRPKKRWSLPWIKSR